MTKRITFFVLRTVTQKTDARRLDAQHTLCVSRAHQRKLRQHVGFAIDVCATVNQNDVFIVDRRQNRCQSRTLNTLDTPYFQKSARQYCSRTAGGYEPHTLVVRLCSVQSNHKTTVLFISYCNGRNVVVGNNVTGIYYLYTV